MMCKCSFTNISDTCMWNSLAKLSMLEKNIVSNSFCTFLTGNV